MRSMDVTMLGKTKFEPAVCDLPACLKLGIPLRVSIYAKLLIDLEAIHIE